jgi:hypothetical protein
MSSSEAAESHSQAEIARLRGIVAVADERKERQAQAPAASKDTASAPPGAPQRGIDLLAYIQKDPLYADVHRRRMLQQVQMRYGDLKYLGLQPDQEAKLTLLLSNKMSSYQDGHEAALTQGIADGTPEMARAIGDTTKAADDEIKAMVGDSGFQDLAAHSNLIAARNGLNMSLGSTFISSGQSLSPDQINALADVQAQFKGSQSELEQAIRDRASQVLSPEQLEIFMQNRVLDQDSQALQQRAMDAAKKETGTSSFHWGNW